MDNEEITITERIVEILSMTFKAIDKCYDNNNEKEGKANYSEANSRLLFPKLRDKEDKNGKTVKGECRISEQELRFLFIEKFNQYCQYTGWNAYYSVETPTETKYKFSGKENGKRQSALFDVCIHNETGKRICLIEFKAKNPSEKSYNKDFEKLDKEKVSPGFFVQLLKNQDSGTIKSIQKKIKSNLKNVNYVCHTLESKNRRTEYISSNKIDREEWYKLDLGNLS